MEILVGIIALIGISILGGFICNDCILALFVESPVFG